MKKTDDFVWNDAANAAFEDLKRQLAEPLVLAAPVDKEPLLLYVAASFQIKSSVFFINWYSGMAFSPKRLIHRLKAAMRPASRWTSFMHAGLAREVIA